MTLTIVKDITDAAKVLIDATLPAEYTQLDYEHDVEANHFNNKTKRFGFISLGADFAEGELLKHVTMDHVFQLILTTDFNNQDDDVSQTSAKNELWERHLDLLKVLINQKLGLTSVVLNVSGISFDAPEFIDDTTVVVIRANLQVKYRFALLT